MKLNTSYLTRILVIVSQVILEVVTDELCSSYSSSEEQDDNDRYSKCLSCCKSAKNNANNPCCQAINGSNNSSSSSPNYLWLLLLLLLLPTLIVLYIATLFALKRYQVYKQKINNRELGNLEARRPETRPESNFVVNRPNLTNQIDIQETTTSPFVSAQFQQDYAPPSYHDIFYRTTKI